MENDNKSFRQRFAKIYSSIKEDICIAFRNGIEIPV